MSTLSPQSEPLPFPAHARIVARAVRGAFADLLAELEVDPHEPQAISRRLKLNKNLAWKISKVIQADDTSVALGQMPGAAGVKIFLRATEDAGVERHLLEHAQQAVEQYDQLIEIHSGDRATLDMMGSTLSDTGNPQRDEHHRKLLFQGASYIWGAQSRVITKVGLVGPGREPGLLDFAAMHGLVDFRRLRPDVSWVMATRNSNNDDGSSMASKTEPIDQEYDDVPLMAEFCSKPLPELRTVRDNMFTRFELVEGPVGNTGALTCVVGAIQRDIPYYKTPTNEWGEHSAICNTPAELLVLDLFFHESLTFALEPEAILYSRLDAVSPSLGTNRTTLPLNEPVQKLGAGPLLPTTPEVPRYSRMVKAMFDRTGWSLSEFHGFRMKIAYPVIPSALVLRYRLPDAPA
jgi:hypothetical protein